MTYGGSGSPQPLTFVPGDVPADDAWQYAVGDVSFSDLQTAFPTGVYQFDLTGDGQPSTSVQVDYTGDAFSNVPFITNFSALAGLDASSPFVVDLNTYVPGSTATDSLIFFSIVDSLNNVVFSTKNRFRFAGHHDQHHNTGREARCGPNLYVRPIV